MKKYLILIIVLLLFRVIADCQFQGEGCGYIPSDLRSQPSAVTIEKVKMTPAVIHYNLNADILFEAYVVGTASKLTLNVDGKANDFYDTGLNGDKKANDNIYSLKYPSVPIIARLKDTDAFRPFLGFLEFYENGVKLGQYSIFPGIVAQEMPVVNIVSKGTGVQSTGRIINIVGPNGDGLNYATIAKRFYTYYADNFDFINFVHVPGYFGNRYHASVANSVQGIGLMAFNSTNEYGSKGQLKGLNIFPILSLYDGASTAYIHEIGHQWINFLQNTPFKPGVPHWPSSSTAIGIMGISIGGAGGAGGNFFKKLTPTSGGYNLTNDPEPIGFNQWELYLMGLIPKEDISNPALIFKNQAVYPSDGFYPNSDFTTYTITEMVGAVGQRIPNNIQSQKKFRIGTIVISDELLSQPEMAYIDFMTARAELTSIVNTGDGFAKIKAKPFFVATEGKGSLNVSLDNTSDLSDDPIFEKKISTYPVPFDDVINIKFDKPTIRPYTGILTDILGNQIKSFSITPDIESFSIEVLNVKPGIYILTLRDEFHIRSFKLIR